MLTLPFSLKVPGDDRVQGGSVRSTEYRFHGLLRFEGTSLQLEWAGTASIDEVAGMDVASRTVALPRESLEVPVTALRRVEVRGGWLRPRLELATLDIATLRLVPGEERGEVRLWVARRDRAVARTVAAALSRAMATPSLFHTLPPGGMPGYRQPGKEERP